MSYHHFYNIFVNVILISQAIFLKPANCSIEDNDIDGNSNSTVLQTVFDSFIRCYVRNSETAIKTDCLKDNLYPVMDRVVRKNLDYVFTQEERAELSKFHPMLKRAVQIMARSNAGWLDSNMMNQLKSFIDSEDSTVEGRRRRNRYQYLLYPIMFGYIMVPIVYKILAAIAVKALVIGKAALIISAILLFHNKHSVEHGHHETVQHQIVS